MDRRTLITAAAHTPFLATPMLAQDRLSSLLNQIVGMDRFRAIAIWRDGGEIEARGYH